MFSFGKSKRVVNIVLDDHVIRLVENNGDDLSSIKISTEKLLPENIIENGKIVDELAFYKFMKSIVKELGLKNRRVRFHVPQEIVILRELKIPKDVQANEFNSYITMEIGHTIHFPFKDPVFDIYNTSTTEVENKVTVLAAPQEEVMKYTTILADVKLDPIAVDVQPLSVYRYFYHTDSQVNGDDVYLFLELDLTSTNISIFHNNYLEFLRYQSLNVSIHDWQPVEENDVIHWTFTGDEARLLGEIDDQVNEIDRLMNFYRYSIHQGEKSITNIVLLGNYPNLQDVKQRLQYRYDLPITILTVTSEVDDELRTALIPALGLALKGR